MIKNRFILSKFIIIIFSLLIGRFLFPIGDEPDYFLRAIKVIKNIDYYNLTINKNTDIYQFFRFLFSTLSENSYYSCNLQSSPTDFFAKIDYTTCTDTIKNILIRFLLTIFFFLIIVAPLYFNKTYFTLKYYGLRCSLSQWNLRKEILLLSILFPSLIYHLGFLSAEAVTLLLSLLIFLFRGSHHFVMIILFLIFLIDYSDALIVFGYYIFISTVIRYYKFFYYWIFFFLISSLFILIFRETIILFLSEFFFKFNYIFLEQNFYNTADKYNLILRPIITYLGFIFLTANKIKVIPLYILFSFFLAKFFFSIIKKIHYEKEFEKKKKFIKNFLIFVSSFFLIINIVFIFPSHSFVKYYIFIFPFFLLSIVDVYKLKNVFIFAIISNIVVFLNLLIYYK